MTSPLRMPYDHIHLAVMADISIRTWIKDAIAELEKRDPIDAVDDSRLVANLMALRSTETLNRWRNDGD